MADKIKKYLDTTALETLVTKIKEADATTLTSAQGYADGLAKNYDAAGSAATALVDAKAYTDTLANGQVATNKADIAKLNGDASTEGSVAKAIADAKALIDADIDVVEGVANQNKTDIAAINNADTGILAQAKAYTDTEVAKVDAIADKNAVDIETLSGKVATLEANGYDDTEVRGLIQGNTEAINTLSGTHATDKATLEGAIALKADQSALDQVSAVANAAVKQSDYDTKVAALEDEDARIEGLVTAEAERAAGVESGLNERLVEVEAFFKLAEGETLDQALDTLVEIQGYITNEGAAADQMVLDIAANAKAIENHIATDHDFASADATLKTELEGQINAKADSSVVTELSGKVSANEQSILALQGVDTGLADRITALEAKHGDGEGTVESLIATAKAEAIAEAKTDASNKDAVVLAESQKYIDAEIDKVEVTIDTLQGVVDGKAEQSEVNTISGKVGTLETKVGTLETEMDAVEALAAAADAAAKANAQAIALKASQEDLNNAVGRIAANETAISTINTTLADKAEQDDLDAAVARITANETAIAANTSAINSFTPITSDEVNAMFA